MRFAAWTPLTAFLRKTCQRWRRGHRQRRHADRQPAPGSSLHLSHPAARRGVRDVRHRHRRTGHRRQLHRLQRRQHPAAAAVAVRRSRAPGLDRQPRYERPLGPDDSGRAHAGSARADAVDVGGGGLLRVLRRRRQPAQRPRRARAAERRAGLGQLLRHSRRAAAARTHLHGRGEQVAGTEGRALESWPVDAALRLGPRDRRHVPDAERRAVHGGRRAAGLLRLRVGLRAGQPLRSLLSPSR